MANPADSTPYPNSSAILSPSTSSPRPQAAVIPSPSAALVRSTTDLTASANPLAQTPDAEFDLQAKPFPHPSAFTFLPDLYNLISRLSLLQAQTSQNGITASPALSRDSKGSNDIGGAPLGKTLSKDSTNTITSTLEIKDLPGLVYHVQQKIQAAKEIVRGLPDIERSISDQEEEIRRLEGQVAGLNKRVEELGQLAGRENRDDDGDLVMEGIEKTG